MIYAHFYRSREAGIYTVEITGHAESGPYGYDLVCSAVSALSIGIINSLSELGHYTPHIEMDEEEGGYLAVTLPASLTKEQKHTSDILLESLLLSLRSVANEYSDFVTIIEHLK